MDDSTLADCPKGVRFDCARCRRIVILPVHWLLGRYAPEKRLAELRPRCRKCGSREGLIAPYRHEAPSGMIAHYGPSRS